ncbi:unnamed protein product [Ophioblennius macclurei]
MKMDFTLVLMAVLLPGFQEAVAFEVKAEEGEEIKIKCVHSNADSNIKYFCRANCADKDVLVTSTKKDENGKYKIENKGNTFFVTVSRATLADSGTYWCGIDRVGVDTYTRVDIVVTKRSSDHKGSEALSGITPTTKKLLYIGTGLGVVGLALAVVLLAFFRHRKKRVSSSAEKGDAPLYATPSKQKKDRRPKVATPSVGSQNQKAGGGTDGTTEDIDSNDSSQPEAQQEALCYSSVSFKKHADCSAPTPSVSTTIYSSVEHKSTDEATVYSNV